jgi:hypothetical protein
VAGMRETTRRAGVRTATLSPASSTTVAAVGGRRSPAAGQAASNISSPYTGRGVIGPASAAASSALSLARRSWYAGPLVRAASRRPGRRSVRRARPASRESTRHRAIVRRDRRRDSPPQRPPGGRAQTECQETTSGASQRCPAPGGWGGMMVMVPAAEGTPLHAPERATLDLLAVRHGERAVTRVPASSTSTLVLARVGSAAASPANRRAYGTGARAASRRGDRPAHEERVAPADDRVRRHVALAHLQPSLPCGSMPTQVVRASPARRGCGRRGFAG